MSTPQEQYRRQVDELTAKITKLKAKHKETMDNLRHIYLSDAKRHADDMAALQCRHALRLAEVERQRQPPK